MYVLKRYQLWRNAVQGTVKSEQAMGKNELAKTLAGTTLPDRSEHQPGAQPGRTCGRVGETPCLTGGGGTGCAKRGVFYGPAEGGYCPF